MKVLLELRPAFDGHSGIPQETRLLFWGLGTLPHTDVIGLIQSANLVCDPGLPASNDKLVSGLSSDAIIDRLSRVVISLQQSPGSGRLDNLRKRALRYLGPAGAAVSAVFGGRVTLGIFEPKHFTDFVWRSMFAKSLPEQAFDLVTSSSFRVMRWPWSFMHAFGFFTAPLGRALYPCLDTVGIDVMIAETPYPAGVRYPTRMVVRYHDAFPLLMPHTTKERHYHRAAHYNALRRNANDGAWFACVSDATRQDLLSFMPDLADRAVTIPNMVSHHFFHESSLACRVPEIVWSRRNRNIPQGGGADIEAGDLRDGAISYLLMVGTIEPRKNHLALLDAWELLRADGFSHLHLVFVGSLGWEHDLILKRLSPWLKRGGLHLLEGVPSSDLRVLYTHAAVTVCPSFGEGFDFPGVEAMRCGGVVAASDIPVHRGIFGEACEYFNPYSTEALVRTLRSLIAPDANLHRQDLVRLGAGVAEQYLPERVLPQWNDFLHAVVA